MWHPISEPVLSIMTVTGCDEKTVINAQRKSGYSAAALRVIVEVHHVRGMVNRSCRNCECAKDCALNPAVLDLMRKSLYGARVNDKVLEEVRNESRKNQVQAPAPDARDNRC